MTLFGLPGRGGRRDAELAEEIRTHLEMAIRDRMARGESRVEAEQAARREFGNELLVREVTRDMWGWEWAERIGQDLRYAIRSLARSPGLVLGVFLTLGLGLGANAAAFSLLDRLFLRKPEGITHAERIHRLYRPAFGSLDGPTVIPFPGFTYPELRAIRSAVGGAAIVAPFRLETDVTLGRGDAARKLVVVWAGPGYFAALGLRAERGRFFASDELVMGGGARVAVLSDAFWRGTLGGDPAAIGRNVDLNGKSYTVVGVAPRGFRGIDLNAADVWLPLSAYPGARQPVLWLEVIARSRPGAHLGRVLAAATAALGRAAPPDRLLDLPTTVTARPIVAAGGPGKQQEAIPLAARLGGVSLIVLLIACANVATLLLVRALRRRREIAVRLALGISRRRLTAQILTESVLLALLAAGGSILVGIWGGRVLRKLLLPATHWAGPVLSGEAVLAIVLAALVCGVAAGLVPALQATRPDVMGVLKGGTRDGRYRPSRVRQGLIVVQSALSVLLLVGAGLFLRSLRMVEGADIGFQADRLIFARAYPRNADRPAGGVLERAAERLRRLHGVEDVALASFAPMEAYASTRIFIPGRDSLAVSVFDYPTFNVVSPEFFATTGLRLLAGRGFQAGDGRGTAPVVVVNRTMARVLWPGENPVGKCIRLQAPGTPCRTIVGMVEDGRKLAVVEPPRLMYYLPLGQEAGLGFGADVFIVRTPPERAAAVATAADRLLRRLIPGKPPQVRRMEDDLAPQYRPWRLGAALLGAPGLLALLVAAVGVYSSLAYAFSQRRREMGLRVALGAPKGAIMALVLREALGPVLVGVAASCILALAAGRLVASALYMTSAHDPRVLAAAGLMLIVAAFAASIAPAWRAAMVDPATELRAE